MGLKEFSVERVGGCKVVVWSSFSIEERIEEAHDGVGQVLGHKTVKSCAHTTAPRLLLCIRYSASSYCCRNCKSEPHIVQFATPSGALLASAGSDGTFNFWDKDSKLNLMAMLRCSQPITCSNFNNDGSIFAYAVGYDGSKGAENHNPSTAKTYIFLHRPQEADVKWRP